MMKMSWQNGKIYKENAKTLNCGRSLTISKNSSLGCTEVMKPTINQTNPPSFSTANKPKLFGTYSDRILEGLQHTFAPMHRRVWSPNWNNSIFAYARQPYYICDWQTRTYEIHIPIGIDGENIMHYWRVCIKIFHELDQETIKQNQPNMEYPWIKPLGITDSETIMYIAQKPSETLKTKLRSLYKAGGKKAYMKGLLRGFRHKNKRGYFTFIIIHESPEIALKRIKDKLINFIHKRIKAFLRKLKLPTWKIDECVKKRNYFSINILIEKYSLTIRTILKNMTETLLWLMDRQKELLREIGRQNIIKTKIQPLTRELAKILPVFKQRSVFRNPDVPDPPLIKVFQKVIGL